MSSVNKVILVGNVGKNPEIKTMQNGKEVATFSVATSDTWKDKNTGEKKEATEWHNVDVYSEGLVRVIKQYVAQGTKLYIEGKLKTSKYQDKKTGTDKYRTSVVLQGYDASLVLLGGGDNKPQGREIKRESKLPIGYDAPEEEQIDDDIPF